MKELPVGTEIKLPFLTLEIVETEGVNCRYCYLSDLCDECGNIVYDMFGTCCKDERKDKKSIYFKKQKK